MEQRNLEFLFAKDLAKEIELGEQTIRRLAKTYEDFPQVRIGNRRLFQRDAVLRWLEKYSTSGVKL